MALVHQGMGQAAFRFLRVKLFLPQTFFDPFLLALCKAQPTCSLFLILFAQAIQLETRLFAVHDSIVLCVVNDWKQVEVVMDGL